MSDMIRYYVAAEELFVVLLTTHQKLGHGGRDRMIHKINNKYKNITAKEILFFLKLCKLCQQKKSSCK